MEMISYTESQGNSWFDWSYELNKPLKEIDWDVLEVKAGYWVTCACGNLCDVIPRDSIGRPIDMGLRQLGVDFYDAIYDTNPSDALSILVMIESRSNELILELSCESK